MSTENKNYYITGILPEYHYRFVMASNAVVAAEAAKMHGASDSVARLMGEAMLGAFFLSTFADKQDEITVSLHLELNGPAERVIAFAKSSGAMRALSAYPEKETGIKTGVLNVNRWKNHDRIYSSTVELKNAGMDHVLEEFIARSEQVQSFIKFTTENHQFQGYMFQALPGASADDTDAVIEIIQENKLFQGGGTFAGFAQARILKSGQFYLFCECSREKIDSIIINLGRNEVEQLIREEGTVEITCEFCKKKYIIAPDEALALFT